MGIQYVGLSIDPAILAMRIPKFILQPLVENSLIHGIEGKTGLGIIRVKAEQQGGNWCTK
ncbi:hypothetical protein AGMMS49579_24700 [Spirochaetia bacterium]|nr:hypothetical protein AGMMS49579_24700 [Spirochaetia bacterium]